MEPANELKYALELAKRIIDDQSPLAVMASSDLKILSRQFLLAMQSLALIADNFANAEDFKDAFIK